MTTDIVSSGQRDSDRRIVLISSLLCVIAGLVALWGAGQLLGSMAIAGFEGVIRAGLTMLVALLGAVAFWSAAMLPKRNRLARYIAMSYLYLAAVGGMLYLLHQWGFFVSFDTITGRAANNMTWLWGIGAALLLALLAGNARISERFSRRLQQIARFVTLASFVVLLLHVGLIDAVLHILRSYAQPNVILATLIVLTAASLAYQLTKLGPQFGETTAGRAAWQGWLLLSPNLIGFALFFAGPLVFSLLLSFTNDTVGTDTDFVGLGNYGDIVSIEIQWQEITSGHAQSLLSDSFAPLLEIGMREGRLVIGAKDTLFWISLFNTIVLCLLLVPTAILPALGLALILNTRLRGVKIFRALFFLPSVAAVVGTAVIWRWLYDPTIGMINYAIGQLVEFLNRTFNISLTDPAIEWLTDPGVVLISVLLLAAWSVIGFNMVLFLGGLQNIPRDLYEAAVVDGAGRWARFQHITLPMLGPTTLFVIVTTVINALQIFNEPFILLTTDSPLLPPEGSTMVYNLYRRGFTRFEFGYSSALAWILFVIIFMVTLVQFRLFRPQAYAEA
ncbi:MAG: hypothetical protein OHK0046_42910 [Anaerolineae bacterium]